MEQYPLLTRYRLTFSPDGLAPRPEWGYRLYAALLKSAPPAFGARVHENGAAPVSQFFASGDGGWVWTVSLLGEDCARTLTPRLETLKTYLLDREHASLQVEKLERQTVEDVDALFALAQARGGADHLLRVRTPAAFKSQRQYVSLPTPRLLVQNLVNRWNSCIPQCPIEDADGQGVQALADGLAFRRFHLDSQVYYLKGSGIPGFVGELTVENRLRGFHSRLADALLLFAGFSGVGIKTTLGMGGIEAGPPAGGGAR